jgi:squalene synthase HpnC
MAELVVISGGRILGDELAGAPDDLQTPEERPTVDDARLWCRHLATTHYENFHVATWFLPERVRPHFESVYAYCRVSDDLGDEVATPEIGMRLLRTWGEMLDECYEAPERSRHPVFVALRETIVACELPKSLFAELLMAFRQDQVVTDYETWDELLAYSRFSANPVGRLVLLVCGYRDEERARLSDKVCTALQLANFWQDVVEDADRGRRYLPAEYMEAFRVDDGQLAGRVFTPEYRAMMKALVERTRAMLQEGGEISANVDHELAVTLNLFRRGGDAILNGIAAQDYDTLRGRPVVTKAKKLLLLGGALLEKFRWRRSGGEVGKA